MVIEENTTPLQVGPRLKAEVERCIRELKSRHNPTSRDRRQLEILGRLLEACTLGIQGAKEARR